MSSSQCEFLDFSDLEGNEYQNLLGIIEKIKDDIYVQSQEASDAQLENEDADEGYEGTQDNSEDNFLTHPRNESLAAGISFFIDGGTAEDVDPEKIPPMLLQMEDSSEVSGLQQEEMVCMEEQLGLYPTNSEPSQPQYMTQPPPPLPPNMQNLATNGSPLYNMSQQHTNYPPHSSAGVQVPNAIYSHMPPGPPHMTHPGPTVYVENCHVNFAGYGAHQQPPATMYGPNPAYHQGSHQPLYSPYVMTDQTSLPLQVKPHDKGEYDRKRHDQLNRGAFRSRGIRGRGRRRGRDEHERSNSVSSDHSSYSDSGVKSYKENGPPSNLPANPYQAMYQYPYGMSYTMNPIPRHGTPMPILHPQYIHEHYAPHPALMTYPHHQPQLSVGHSMPHEHPGMPIDCDQYGMHQNQADHHAAIQQQQIAVTSQSTYIVSTNHGSPHPECIYTDPSMDHGNMNFQYAPPSVHNFSHEQEIHEFEEQQVLKSVPGIYRSEDIGDIKERYYEKDILVTANIEAKQDNFQTVDLNGESEEHVNKVPIDNLMSSPSSQQKGDSNIEEIPQYDNAEFNEKTTYNERNENSTQHSIDNSVIRSPIKEPSLAAEDTDSTVLTGNHDKPDLSDNQKEIAMLPIHKKKVDLQNLEGPLSIDGLNDVKESSVSITIMEQCIPPPDLITEKMVNGKPDYPEEPQSKTDNKILKKEEELSAATTTNEALLLNSLESISIKEQAKSSQSQISKSTSIKFSPHRVELDSSCSFSDIEESNNIVKSASGSLTVYKSTQKSKHVENQGAKTKNKHDHPNNNEITSRSSSKESLKDSISNVLNKHVCEDLALQANEEVSINFEPSSHKPTQEAAWGQKKSWSQLFKPNEDISNKQIAYISPFNAQENMRDNKGHDPSEMEDGSINYSDVEAEKSKVGALLKSYSPDYRPVQLVPRGLINKNYWCYVNAPLQALLACPSFYQLMQGLSKEAGCKSGNSSTPFINSIVDIGAEFTVMPPPAKATRKEKGVVVKKEPEVTTGSPFEPTCVYKMLINCKENQFTEGRQQDAEEMLSCVLNGLHDEMVESLKLVGGLEETVVNGTTTNGDKNNTDYDLSEDEHEWKVQGPKKKSCITRTAHFTPSPISQIFWGRLRSVLQQAGGSTTANLQPFNSLPLDIQSPKVDSVKDALNQLVMREDIIGFTCPKTNQEVTASNQVMLEDLPRVLILQLKRFIYDKDGGLQKVTKRLQFSIDLEITKDLISMNSRGKFTASQRKYKLFAIVNHEGKEATKGHYVADVFHNGYNCWLRYDDSNVKPIQESAVLRHEPPRVPYLLFYRRNDTFASPHSNNNNSSSNINNNNNNTSLKPK